MTHLLAATTSDLLAAREQMAFTLAFHIVLASFGISFPAITLIANYRGLRRNDEDAMTLARRWSKVQAVLFAVGAVSGTVLTLEFGLLWPGLMGTYGPVFGIPFAIEGLFFFTEAIFLAIYIYGWDRMKPWNHFWAGVPVALAGIGGAFSVVTANSWMNQPVGFTTGADGQITDVQPLAAIFNPAWWYEVPHMLLAGYAVGGFLTAAVYAMGMLRGRRDRYHRLGFLIPFTVGCIVMPIQMFVGDTAARAVYQDQPIKFAAMELNQTTGPDKPENVGGVLIDGEVRYGVPIPDVASYLAGFSADTVIVGLDTVPPEDRPNANVVHLAFDVMVFSGSAMMLLAVWFALVWWRKRRMPATRWFLWAAVGAGALSVVALESGWIVTEVGRQPWIVYNLMRTSDAVTQAGGIWWTFGGTLVLYAAMGVIAVRVLLRMAARWRDAAEVATPYGPGPGLTEAARDEPAEAGAPGGSRDPEAVP